MIELRICIDVDDLEKGIEFYTRALGLSIGRRLGGAWAELSGASSPIDLIAKPAGTSPCLSAGPVRDYRRHWTPVHLDFVVSDLEAAVRRAQDAGAVLERDIQTQTWGRMANLADVFGHGICLIQYLGRGYDELVAPQG